MTRSTVEILGVDAAAVLADPADDPAAAVEGEAEDVGLPPAALPALPVVPPLLDILFELCF